MSDPEFLNFSLRKGVRQRDREAVRIALADGADVHCDQHAALIDASRNGDIEIAALLIEHGALDAEARDKVGRTDYLVGDKTVFVALMAAIYNDDVEMTKLLLEAGLPFMRDHQKIAIQVIRDRHDGLLPLFIQYGLPLDDALWTAIEEEHPAAAQIVLEDIFGGAAVLHETHAYWTLKAADPEMLALMTSAKTIDPNAAQNAHRAKIQHALDEWHGLEGPERQAALITQEGVATTLLYEITAARLLEKAFAPERWHGREAEARALLKRLPDVLPARYHPRIAHIDVSQLAEPPLTQTQKLRERQNTIEPRQRR